MTPEAKKRKNQKKKQKQKQRKAAEKVVNAHKEPNETHGTPESTISTDFENGLVNRTGSEMTPESDVLPVSSSTNISSVNDTQLESSSVRELHDEVHDEPSQHGITGDTSNLANDLVIESNSSIMRTEPNMSLEDTNGSSDFILSEPSLDAMTVEPNDYKEPVHPALTTVKEDNYSEKECENYDSVIITSNDSADLPQNYFPPSSGSLLSAEIPPGSTPKYDTSLDITDNDELESHYDDKYKSFHASHEPSKNLAEEENDPLKLQAHVPTQNGKQDITNEESTSDLFGSSAERPEDSTRTREDDPSELFQVNESNEKLPWEEDAEKPLFSEAIDESHDVFETIEDHNESLPCDGGSDKPNNFMSNTYNEQNIEENPERSYEQSNTQGTEGQNGYDETNSETENEKFAIERNSNFPSPAEGDIIEPNKDSRDETRNLFEQSTEQSGEVLPWEADNKNTEVTSEVQESHEDLFAGADNSEKLPWEVSEDQISSGNTENTPQVSTEKTPEKKFSFLEEDDDLLDDNDSFLASSEEEEEEEEEENVAISDNTAADLNLKSPEENRASKYEPSIEQQTRVRQEQAQFATSAGIVTPQQFHGLARGAFNTSSQQTNVPTVASPNPPVLKDNRSVRKIIEEKKKSDAYDFPLEIISESSKKGHAKPVAVPTQRFGSGNSFSSLEKPIPQSRKSSSTISSRPPVNPLSTQIPRSSRTNSGVSQSPLNYAFPNPYNVQQSQQPSIQANKPLPSVNIPPPTLQVETATSAPPIRARGISNASIGSATSFGARRSTQYGINNGLSPVSPYNHPAINLPTANKYAPVSPTAKQVQYPSIAQNLVAPVVNNPNFVKTHRSHTSSISSYTPNEYASRYAPNNQQSYQIPHGPQPVAPGAGNLTYQNQNQHRNSHIAPMIPKAQLAASRQPPMNVQPLVGGLPLATTQAPVNVQPLVGGLPLATTQAPVNVQPLVGGLPLATTQAPVNLQPHNNNMNPANLPAAAGMLPMGIAHQSNNIATSLQENNVVEIDNEAILRRQFPIFHWSPANKVVYGVPSAPDQSQYIGSSNFVQDIKIIPIGQIVKPDFMLKSFPGPLSSAKLKKKDLIKWIETTSKAISEKDPSTNMTIWQLLEMKLSDRISWKDISNLLYNSGELSMYLSQPFPDTEMIPNAYRLDVNCQMRVLAFLQIGNHDEALRLALRKRDYSIALLIGSLMGKDKWSEVIQKYLYEEFTTEPDDRKVLANFLFLIFQVFVGNSKMAIKHFYSNKETSQWAMENWKSIVAAVLINIPENTEEAISIPPVVLEFLIEFGIFLTKKGLTLAASTLFIIGNVPLSDQPVMVDSDVVFKSIGNPNTTESVLWCEIYEYIFSCDSKFKEFSSILPHKVYHASLLQEQGLTNLGTKYTDYLASSIKKLPKKDALTINLTHDLSEVVTRLSESNTGWLAKPKLSSVWGQLDKSFNKYIGGDDIDALNKKNDKKKVFDGFTPGSSANSSTVDLTQTFTPFQTQVTSQSYVDTTALLHNAHNAHNAPNQSVVHSKPFHASKGLVELGLPYTHRIGESLQGSPQRIQSTQYTAIDSQMTSLRRVRTDQHATETTLKGHQILEQNPISYAPQSGQNHSIPMEKSNSNAPSLSAEFAPPPKFGRVSSYYMSSPDLVRRESIISTGSDFLPPPKIGVPAKANSSQGSLMYSPSVEALPMEPLVPPNHEKLYNDVIGKNPEENVLEHEYQTSENNSTTDQNTLKDVTEVAGEMGDTETPVFEDRKTSSMEINNKPDYSANPIQPVGDKAQPEVSNENIVRAHDSNTDNALPSSNSEQSDKKLPGHGPRLVSTYLPPIESVSIVNDPHTHEQGVANNFNITTPKPVEQPVSHQKPNVTKAANMHYSPYMPQAPGASVDTDVPTIPETSPSTFVSPQPQISTPSPYYPLANATNESPSFGLPKAISQSQNNSNAVSENRFSPIKKAEVVEKDAFEPTIRKASTNLYKAFKPLETEVGKYNDVIEEESDDENISADEGKNRKEEKKNDSTKKESRSMNKDIDDKSSWFGWLKKDAGDKKVYKAKLGHKNTLYYDEKLKRWVNKDATEEEKQKIVETSAPPPPPIVKRKDTGPKTKPRSGPINNAVPPVVATSVIPNNPITGKPLSIKSPPPSSPGANNVDNSPPQSSPVSNISGVNLTGKKANGLDDLLSLTGGPKPASTRRKKKSTRGYVNVMDNIQ